MSPAGLAGIVLILAMGHSGAAKSAEQPRSRVPPVDLEFGGSYEALTNDLPDWKSVYVEAAYSFKARHTIYGGLRETQRFSFDDSEANAGLYYPLSDTWTGFLAGSASPTHNVLPQYSLHVGLQKSVGSGWNIGVSGKFSSYTTTDAKIVVLDLEKYWRNFRGAYTLYESRVEGSGWTPAHRFQINYYYGSGSSVGVSYTTGRELDSVGPPFGVITTDVRAWTFFGRHWFSAAWALSFDLVDQQQGELYRRRGVRVGLRHRF